MTPRTGCRVGLRSPLLKPINIINKRIPIIKRTTVSKLTKKKGKNRRRKIIGNGKKIN